MSGVVKTNARTATVAMAGTSWSFVGASAPTWSSQQSHYVLDRAQDLSSAHRVGRSDAGCMSVPVQRRLSDVSHLRHLIRARLQECGRPIVVSVSGFAGSGKSTLAREIVDGVPEIVRMRVTTSWSHRDRITDQRTGMASTDADSSVTSLFPSVRGVRGRSVDSIGRA